MKKIIATVLAMVMALALCTTAMAATTSTSTVNGTTTTLSDSDKYNLRALNSNEAGAYWTSATTTTMSTKTVTTDGKDTKSYIPAYYTFNGTNYYVCDAKVPGAQRLFKDNTFVSYVKDGNYTDYLAAATNVTKGTDCGAYANDGVKVDDKVYTVATTAENAVAVVVDGKLVLRTGTEVEIVKHDFSDGATVTYKANSTTPVSIVCKTCKKSFEVVKANELGSYAGSYAVTGNADGKTDAIAEGYVIKLDAATTGTTTGTTTSPKTFDAGIAMYVGMALTSVAGSAVVIGKKKEF